MLVISCHADTGFNSHALRRLEGGQVEGQLDNFAGVHAVMLAYFSGRLTRGDIRIALTHGEELGCLGAIELLPALGEGDLVAVVDVTGSPTRKDFTVEKCGNARVEAFLRLALGGLSYDLYRGCPDPVSDADETDVYVEKCPFTFFLGLPVEGGDYNAGPVRCRLASIQAVAEAICRIAEQFDRF